MLGTCREKKINDAVRFAQETLSPLRGIMSHRSTEYDAMLHDTVALIAYEEPEVRHHLLALSAICDEPAFCGVLVWYTLTHPI